MHRKLLLAILLAAVQLGPASAPAQEGFYVVGGRPMVGTGISSLPYTISTPGYYYLTRNLSYNDGHGITVNADNVTIDLMGFTLTGSYAGSSYRAVYIPDQDNVEIRNGTLTGWSHGVYSAAGNNHRVIGVRAVGNETGISLNHTNHLIQGCTAYPGGFGSGWGLSIGGGAISGCTVGDFDTGIGIGYGVVSGNEVSDCSIGINTPGNAAIRHNQVNNCGTGIRAYGGASITGNTVSSGTGQTGIVPATDASRPDVLDQNCVSGAGTHYGPGSAATVWGANGG